ncbi:MAG TPA: AsmA-like C-terminal region-containing protein [Rickettsiales bacterium]|nr:AsmA-like C-terminal region-containing protein [Rickettsiales bacterium]
MKKSFKSIKKFITIRNLCFFIFKICVAILLILSTVLVSFIIIFSVKPRTIQPINSYILRHINSNSNINANFDVNNSTLEIDSNLGLRYNIKDFYLKNNIAEITLSEIIINVDFVKIIFGRIDINDIILFNTNLRIDLQELKKKEKSLKQENIKKEKNITEKIYKNSISIKNFKFDNAKIVINLNNFDNQINILKSLVSINLKGNNLKINQDTVFNINNDEFNSNLNIICDKQDNIKSCRINIENINPNSFKTFFGKNSEIYNYCSNIIGYFDGQFNLIFNNNRKLSDGDGIIKSSNGSFYLKNFFDEKLVFKNLIINTSFSDYFDNININSITTDFDKTHFFMSMFIKKEEKFNNINLNFNIQNTPVTDLRKLWPNFLGDEASRPWVLKHFVSGNIPSAKADMNFKYFENKEEKSGLQTINAEIDLDNVLLNYGNHFPVVKNINGKAVFTEKDMQIQIDSANILESKMTKGNVEINFNKNPTDVLIKGSLKGPIYDLFIHIDKNEKNNIKNTVNSIIEDHYTITDLNIKVPLINNITFNDVFINTNSTLFNKKNSLLMNDSKMIFSFTKPKDINEFFGNINLINNNLEYLPLNLSKPSGTDLSFDYSCELNDGIVNIKDLKSKTDFINFIASGFLDIKNKTSEINLENIKYNNSNYNFYYKSKILDGVLINNIEIDGKNINYSNIFNKLNNAKSIVKNKESNAKNKTNVKLNLKYLGFENDKYLESPVLSANFENNNLKEMNFEAKINKDEFVKINLHKKQKLLNTESNNFGTLFQTIGLTNSIIGGSGKINFNQTTENGKHIIYGNIDIDKQFKIITNEKANKDLIPNIKEEKYFKRLTKSLLEESSVRFDKMRGNITFSDNVLKFDEIVANSSFISLQILASGFLNLKTSEIKINGLLMPLGTINGLFGINKLPIIADLVFGQKDAGLFASKFEVVKKDKNSQLDVKIDKFSMIMPGFLRNIFDLDSYKNIFKD